MLFAMFIGLCATVIRLFFTIRFGSPNPMPLDGSALGTSLQAGLILVLWRHPKRLHAVVAILYVYLTVGISLKLAYLLFWDDSALFSEFLWMIPWLSVSFVLSFLLFSRRTATYLSVAVVGVWIAISALFVGLYIDTEQGKQAFLMLSQTYLSQFLLIVFLALYAKLRGLYMGSRESTLQMEQIAKTDFLLGIANRRSIQAELAREINISAQTHVPLCVILMDLDEFKQINDTYGHDHGDTLLVEVTSSVLDVVKSPCLFGRWGGDEFLIVAPGLGSGEAKRLAENVREALEQREFHVGGATASFGVAEFRIGEDIHSLLRRADEALYQSKSSGRNRAEIAN